MRLKKKFLLEIRCFYDYFVDMMKKEYYILNILRGLSALFVLFYHFCIFFFAYPNQWARYLKVVPLEIAPPFYLEAFLDFPIDIGHLGVSYFFLISGFLIPASLERYDSIKTFLIHKILRLWPTYAVCFALGLLFLAVFNVLNDTPFLFTLDHILACFFWVRDIFDYTYIDGAVWSLEVQIKFYIFSILMWTFWKKNFLDKMCYLTIFLSIAAYFLYDFLQDQDDVWFHFVALMRHDIKYFMLILLGTCVYSYFKQNISILKALFLSSILLICFVSYPYYSKNLTYSLGFFSFSVFILLDIKNIKFEGKLSKALNWVSSISYPLYIGHVVPGYIIMYYVITNGFSPYFGIFLAFLYTFLMATIVHKKIEAIFEKITPFTHKKI